MAEGKTPIFDWDKGEFKTDAQGRVLLAYDAAALDEIVIKTCSTPRGIYLIYADPENPERNHKYGSDALDIMLRTNLTEDARNSELKRAVREALINDPWVIDVTNINIYKATVGGETKTYADFVLITKFDTKQIKGALINE